jgi:hypothetical protein
MAQPRALTEIDLHFSFLINLAILSQLHTSHSTERQGHNEMKLEV